MPFAARDQKIKELRALDPDLPFLAAEAAVDIDNMLVGSSRDLRAVRRLAEQLKNSIRLSDTGGSPHSLMDPATLTVLGEAILQARRTSHSNMEDLLTEVVNIANKLSSEDPLKDREELELARAFCIALSQAAMAYGKSIRDLRPSHPFRR